MIDLRLGDCLEVMRGMPENSVDSIVTDPPYGIGFMAQEWDAFGGKSGITDQAVRERQFAKWGTKWAASARPAAPAAGEMAAYEAWCTAWAIEALRVAKPGCIMLAFGGTRTHHRLACAIEDAGWEIRDTVMWVYGSGFPKSADVSKMLDKQEHNRWLDVCKAIDNLQEPAILEAWEDYSNDVRSAGLTFQKNETAIGMSTPKSDSVLAPVVPSTSPEKSPASVIVAELSFNAAPLTSGGRWSFALSDAGVTITELSVPATIVESSHASQEVMPSTVDFSAQLLVWARQNGNITDNLKAVEALRTWLGSKPSSRRATTSALCAALTDDLKRIILSLSKTFLNLDTTQQMEFVSATTATITESTAASLISSTANTLRNKAIDKAAGAEREVVGVSNPHDPRGAAKYRGDSGIFATGRSPEGVPITAPATDLARLWQGWGTALKPAWEPIIVAMKPLDKGCGFAQNAEKWGVAGINVDGCRVGTEGGETHRGGYQDAMVGGKVARGGVDTDLTPNGRWPANLIHDGSEEVLAGFPVTKSGVAVRRNGNQGRGTFPVKIAVGSEDVGYNDTGSAARFFYVAKASRAEREMGLEGMDRKSQSEREGRDPCMNSKYTTDGRPQSITPPTANFHPTVKPLSLMRYLVRLTKTPAGGLVLDPFMGSGTTGMACVLEGRDFVGIELSEEYLEIARKRIESVDTQAQLSLPLAVEA